MGKNKMTFPLSMFFQITCLPLLTMCIVITAVYTRTAFAAETCAVNNARVVSVEGTVEIQRAQTTAWEPADLETSLCAGDRLRVRNHSRAAIRLNNDSMMRLEQRSAITIPASEKDKITAFIELLEGALHIITRTPKPFKVRTPYLNAAVEGTEFYVGVATDHTQVVLFEGRVIAENALGKVTLTDNEAAVAYLNQPPQKEIIVQPLDAVQWALYYPAIIGYARNATDTRFDNPTRQAEHLLSIGRSDEALNLIHHVLTNDPDNSTALALQSIIAIVQNDKDSAFALAEQAVASDNASVPAKLALSYAQQASFDIDAALVSVQQAITLDPHNALLHARLAELYMSVGELDAALQSAHQAANLNPDIAKTQTVLGFAYLLQINTHEAQAVFQQAILLDQADPMPRLGLGLALIREGELEAGRIELEIAASLDPGNSLIRSYLGKAYFEEKRYGTAETQFELAKQRDPLDPTPWFYDAIQKQTQNRPVEALRDIQKSIELNDNRAVYRSKLLLDQDQAGRGSSLARIYDNLGFEKRAIMETAKSLSFDPSNHSAHRFLSDTYQRTPRHEAARVSELLQAQLLQPINVNPVQPRLAVADLNIITNTGPSSIGFNEFAPLMERNRSQFVASGFGGSHSTFGNEVVFSKLYDKTSISLGQFHYQTDGFRSNNDQNHDILNAFIQHAVTPKLNIQAEVRTRSANLGNLLLDFDRNTNDPLARQNRMRRKIDEDAARVGAMYQLTPNQKIIVSGQYVNRKDRDVDIASNTSNFEQFSKESGFQTEMQYQLQVRRFNLLAGFGVYRIDIQQSNAIIDLFSRNQLDCAGCSANSFNRNKTNGYLYTNLNLYSGLTATAGFSYDAYRERDLGIDRFNPKLGLQWNVTDNTRLRFAWTETVKSPLTANQTIEPTQVAGFNQLFDDVNGTKSRRLGIGVDTHYADKIYGGFEVSSRDLKVPLFGTNTMIGFENQKEKLYRGYLYGLISDHWAVNYEVFYEKFSRPPTPAGPHRIETFSMPLRINYFSPSGFFSSVTGTYAYQEVARTGTENEGSEHFFLLDAALGYRLPKRKGIISFEAKNLFDQSFLFRNANFRITEPMNTRFVPSRTLFVRFTVNF